jgi:hypothetical protein
MDNMTIGATTARNASVVDLSVTGTLSFDAAQGTAGQVLTSAGTGVTPTWTTPTTGTVTSVTGTSPVVSSGGNTPAISMPAATTSVSGYLTSTDWNTFNSKGSGTVTSVTGTAPVVSSGGATPAISMAAATGSVNGYLTSTDWTTFNNKGSGSVTSVGGTGTVNGISLSGTVTSSGNLTLGGTLSNVSLSTQVTGTLPIANGGTGETSRQNAINAIAGAVTSGQYLRGNGTDVVMSTIQAADVPTLNQNTTGTAANVTGTVAIGNGGTGQTTANAAYNALSPMTTTGDIEYRTAGSVAARLGIGSTGQVLTVAGGIPSWATPAGGGGISQVVSTTKTDTFTMSSTTYADITGLSVTITPSSSSSKILIMANVNHVGTTLTSASGIRLLRGSTVIGVGDAAGSRISTSGGESYGNYGVTLTGDAVMYLDSPATTSATTYKIQIRVYGSTAYVNRSPVDSDAQEYYRGMSSITVMEVK